MSVDGDGVYSEEVTSRPDVVRMENVDLCTEVYAEQDSGEEKQRGAVHFSFVQRVIQMLTGLTL